LEDEVNWYQLVSLKVILPGKKMLQDELIVIQNLRFRRGSDLNLNQTQSTLKQFNSNELDDASGIKFSGKLTKHEIKF